MYWAVPLLGGVVVLYTLAGGLWGVLITDVVQSIIINLAVLFVVPLVLHQVGGITGFVERAPTGFFAIVSGEYTCVLYGSLVCDSFFHDRGRLGIRAKVFVCANCF